jgi:hypothetical protein
MYHVVLLGDSIFDNAAYVAGDEPDVVSQVRGLMPPGSKATLGAVDGSRVGDVGRQLRHLPGDATHLIVSCGGNDALGHAGILNERASSAAEVLAKLARVGDSFEHDYHEMLTGVLGRGLSAVVCTIYYPRFPDAALQKVAVTALAVFNDCIVRAAFAAGAPLIDLRLVCAGQEDYANPIEPSARGGEKIAAAIVRAVTEHDFGGGRTTVFV